MKRLIGFLMMAVVVFAAAGGTVLADEFPKEEAQADTRKMMRDTLAELYELEPQARKQIEEAAGYAVFSNFGLKIFVAGGGRGDGIAVNNKTGDETFMKMFEVQAGLGFGIKKFTLIWVFDYQRDLHQFVNSGWEFGGQATAAAQIDGEGEAVAGAVSISPGIHLYQIIGDGLALELSVKGTKYFKNNELN
jgi:lipid-binding SYLF domain-containing protein